MHEKIELYYKDVKIKINFFKNCDYKYSIT